METRPQFTANELSEICAELCGQNKDIGRLMRCFRWSKGSLVFSPGNLLIADNYHQFGDFLEEALRRTEEINLQDTTRYKINQCISTLTMDRIPD